MNSSHLAATSCSPYDLFRPWEICISELDDIDAFMQAHRARILRFVLFTTRDRDLAESITQDCFFKAYQARASFRGGSNVKAWLMTIAVNLIRDHFRIQKIKFWRTASATAIDVHEMASVLARDESSAESQLIAREQVARLGQIIETLSPKQRIVFLMRFTEEMDVSEIATALGMPMNTVKVHLHRAVKSVRNQLGGSR